MRHVCPIDRIMFGIVLLRKKSDIIKHLHEHIWRV